MLSPRWKKVARDVALHPGRTALVVLAIAVGIVGAGSVLTTYSILSRVVGQEYRATNPPSAVLTVDAVSDGLLREIRALPSVADAQLRGRAGGRIRVGDDWRPLILFAPRDFGNNRVGRVDSLAGAWPPAPGELALERSSLEVAEAGVGDTLRVAFDDGVVHGLPVTALVRDMGLAPGWMEHVVYTYVHTATLADLGAAPGAWRLRLVAADSALDAAHVRRVAFEVKAFLEARGRRVTGVTVPPPGEHIHAGQMNSLLYLQGAFGLLTLILSGFLVVNLMNAVLAEQVRQIGVMKAVGARTRQVAGIYLVFALAMGLAASALGVPVAGRIGRGYAAFAASLLNFDTAGYGVPRGAVALQLAVGLLLPLLAAAGPVRRGARITVGEAVRDYGIGDERVGLAKAVTGWIPGLSRPWLLSLRNAFRRRLRLALTVLVLTLGGAVFLGALNLRAGIRQTVATTFDGARYHVALGLTRPAPIAAIEGAAGVPGVAGLEAWHTTGAVVDYGDGTQGNAFSITGLPPGTDRVAYPVLEGRWLNRGDADALVVNDRLLEAEPDVRVGAAVTLAVDGRRAEWRVVGVVRSSPTGPEAFAPRRAVAAAAGAPGTGDRVVVVASSADPVGHDSVREDVEAALEAAGIGVRTGSTVHEAERVLADHMLMAAGFLVALAVLVIVVGGLGLATTMNLAVLERTRELGVMRAVGANHGTIRRIIVVEGLAVGALACMLALPLSVPVTVAVGAGFGRIMLGTPVPYVPDGVAVLLWTALVLVTAVLAGLFPAHRAGKRSTAEALAYD